MKYEYGVEYPCNRVKPDLPGDVLIQVRLGNKKCPHQSSRWWYSGGEIKPTESMIVFEMAAADGEWDTEGATSFRIVDERYKPKDHIADVGKMVDSIKLDAEATARLDGLMGNPPEPTDELRELMGSKDERDETIAAAEAVIEEDQCLPANSLHLEILYYAGMLTKPTR